MEESGKGGGAVLPELKTSRIALKKKPRPSGVWGALPAPHPAQRRETTGRRSLRRRCRHRLQLQPSGPPASPLYIASQRAARAAAAAAAAERQGGGGGRGGKGGGRDGRSLTQDTARAASSRAVGGVGRAEFWDWSSEVRQPPAPVSRDHVVGTQAEGSRTSFEMSLQSAAGKGLNYGNTPVQF